MNFFVSGLAYFFGVFLKPIVFRVMTALGIGYMSYQGISGLLSPVVTTLTNYVNNLGQYGPWLNYAVASAELDTAFTIYFSAWTFILTMYATKASMRLLSSGT